MIVQFALVWPLIGIGKATLVVQPLIGIWEKQLWWFGRLLAFEKATLVVQPLIGIGEATLVVRPLIGIGEATLVVRPLIGTWKSNSGGSAALRHLETRVDLNNLGSPQRKYLTGENIPAKGTVICRPAYERVF